RSHCPNERTVQIRRHIRLSSSIATRLYAQLPHSAIPRLFAPGTGHLALRTGTSHLALRTYFSTFPLLNFSTFSRCLSQTSPSSTPRPAEAMSPRRQQTLPG